MHVIIAGGSGLLGRALTKKLVQNGYEVTILSRTPEQITDLPAGANAFKWDGKTAQGWGHLVDGAKGIINLAGESLGGTSLFNMRWTRARKPRIRASRIDAGRAITEAIKLSNDKPSVLIQTSAVGYYGVHADEELTEKDLPGNDFLSQICLDWEASTLEIEKMGVRRVIVRLGVVLDNANFAFKMLKLPFLFFTGGPIGSGKQFLSWIHIDDFVNVILFLLENKDMSGAYNVTAPEPLTNHDFARLLGSVLHRPSWFPVPTFAMKFFLGEVSTIILDGQRVLPERLIEAGYSFLYPQAESAVRQLIGQSGKIQL